eukprot:9951533-Alexandrium_andersonii.AAC.1
MPRVGVDAAGWRRPVAFRARGAPRGPCPPGAGKAVPWTSTISSRPSGTMERSRTSSDSFAKAPRLGLSGWR